MFFRFVFFWRGFGVWLVLSLFCWVWSGNGEVSQAPLKKAG